MAIDFALDEDQELIIQTVDEFTRAELAPNCRDFEARSGVPDSLRTTFAELGLERLGFPEDSGGLGAGDQLQCLVTERLAGGDAGATRALQRWDSWLIALEELADPAQRAGLLTDVPTGHTGGAVAYSEPLRPRVDGEAVFSTNATPTSDGLYQLSGRKCFVSQAQDASLIVFAQLEGDPTWAGVAAFSVSSRADGVTLELREPTTGILAVPVFDVVLDNVVVPATARLARSNENPLALRRFFARAALRSAAQCVGVMDAAWQYARDYASERIAFGKPIAHFQAIAFMLSNMATDTDSARWMVWNAASQLDAEASTALRDTLGAVAHTFDVAKRLTENAVQILGGAGFIEDYPCEKWMRDVRTLTLMFGSVSVCERALGFELMRHTESLDLDELVPSPDFHIPLT